MEIEVNDNTIRLEESGTIKTVIHERQGGRVTSGAEPRLIDEFYPFCGNAVQTQIECMLVQPRTFKKRTFSYRDENYLKREIQWKNRPLYELCNDFNTSDSTLRTFMHKYDIKRPLKNKELLEKLWEEHDTIDSLSKQLQTPTYKVKIALEQKDIIDPYDHNEIYS